jgi:hypothetical protein
MEELQVLNALFLKFELTFHILSQSEKKIIYKTQNDERCIITIDLVKKPIKHLYVKSLEKCDPNSGTEILLEIIEFGKRINVPFIQLTDASYIDGLNLFVLEILTTGQSWYNRFGFMSPNHSEEVKFNAYIAQLPFATLTDYKNYLRSIHQFPMIAQRKKITGNLTSGNLQSEFLGQFPQFNPDDSIQHILTQLKQQYLNKYSTEELDEEQMEVVEDLLEYLEHLIYYDSDLYYHIKKMAGGKKRRICKSKRKKRKRKNTHKNI